VVKRPALVVVGAYLCIVGAIVHRQTSYAAGFGWPWGLVLTLACTASVVHAARQVVSAGVGWLGLGWGAALMALQFSPGKSIIIASDWWGWSFAVGGVGVIVVGALRAPRVEQ